MALKTTPEKKNKRKHTDPRRIYLEEEPQTPRSGKKYSYKHRDSSTIAVVSPRMVQRLPTPANMVQSYRPPYSTNQAYQPSSSLSQTNRPLSSVSQTYRSPSSIYQSYLQPPPVYTVRYAQPPTMPIPSVYPYAPPAPTVRGYHPDTRWCTIVTTYPVQNPIYAIPVPTVPAMPVPRYTPVPQVSPYTAYLGPALIEHPPVEMFSPLPATAATNHMFGPNFEAAVYELEHADFAPPMIANDIASYRNHFVDDTSMTAKLQASPILSPKQTKPLDPEEYLMLPRNLFPPPRTLRVDPNPIIDQFCRIRDCEKHSIWILDLEFGIPRQPVTRPIATYDVQFHSIHCKNTPGAIHPGFESCSYDVKNMFLFYYDFAVSAWYRGFVIMNSDRSVANFQSWLEVPMQTYGMCWP